MEIHQIHGKMEPVPQGKKDLSKRVVEWHVQQCKNGIQRKLNLPEIWKGGKDIKGVFLVVARYLNQEWNTHWLGNLLSITNLKDNEKTKQDKGKKMLSVASNW